jgi:hypothetical protein
VYEQSNESYVQSVCTGQAKNTKYDGRDANMALKGKRGSANGQIRVMCAGPVKDPKYDVSCI